MGVPPCRTLEIWCKRFELHYEGEGASGNKSSRSCEFMPAPICPGTGYFHLHSMHGSPNNGEGAQWVLVSTLFCSVGWCFMARALNTV